MFNMASADSAQVDEIAPLALVSAEPPLWPLILVLRLFHTPTNEYNLLKSGNQTTHFPYSNDFCILHFSMICRHNVAFICRKLEMYSSTEEHLKYNTFIFWNIHRSKQNASAHTDKTHCSVHI